VICTLDNGSVFKIFIFRNVTINDIVYLDRVQELCSLQLNRQTLKINTLKIRVKLFSL